VCLSWGRNLECAAPFVIPIGGKKASCDENAEDTEINDRTGKSEEFRPWLSGNPVNRREERKERV
jgi:hypothetical protein